MSVNDVESHISDLKDILISSATSKILFECNRLLVSACKYCSRGVESVCRSIWVDRISFQGLSCLSVVVTA